MNQQPAYRIHYTIFKGGPTIFISFASNSFDISSFTPALVGVFTNKITALSHILQAVCQQLGD